MDIREFKKWIIENHFEENDPRKIKIPLHIWMLKICADNSMPLPYSNFIMNPERTVEINAAYIDIAHTMPLIHLMKIYEAVWLIFSSSTILGKKAFAISPPNINQMADKRNAALNAPVSSAPEKYSSNITSH